MRAVPQSRDAVHNPAAAAFCVAVRSLKEKLEMTETLSGKTAFVTGATSGVGEALVKELLDRGVGSVIATGRKAEALEALTAIAPNQIITSEFDLANLDQIPEFMSRFTVDLAFLNAGVYHRKPLLEQNLADWERVHAINVTAPTFIAQAVLPHMIEQGDGAIVFTASMAGLNAYPGLGLYGGGKAMIIKLMQDIALSYGPKGVLCNAGCPGYIDTPMLHEAIREMAPSFGMSYDEMLALISKENSIKRLLTPEEVAAGLVDLALPGRGLCGVAQPMGNTHG